jgi:hypothetical protein
MAPRQSGLTFRPVVPSVRYSMVCMMAGRTPTRNGRRSVRVDVGGDGGVSVRRPVALTPG